MRQNTLFTKVLFLIGFIVVSCSIDHPKDQISTANSFSLTEAQSYFEENARDLKVVEYLYSKNLTKAKNQNIVPNWEKAVYANTATFDTYMIPILDPSQIQGMLTQTDGSKKKALSAGVRTESHLVIQKNHRTGHLRRFITTIIGVAQNSNGNPYLYTGDRKHFEGFMLISDETGNCFEAFYYKNGYRLKMHINKNKTTPQERKNSILLQYSLGFSFLNKTISTKGGGGYLGGEQNDEYCYNCHALSNFSVGSCANCGASPSEIGGGDLYYFCQKCGRLEENCNCNPPPETPPDREYACPFCRSFACEGECRQTGGGGGSTTGGGGIPQNKYTPKTGDKLALPNIPNNIGQQLQSTCVPAGMEYVALLFGQNINTGTFLTEYWKTYGVAPDKVIRDGISFDENFIPFINTFFNTVPFTNYTNAIDSGHVIMAAISAGGPLDGHNIIIVGYRPDNSLIYMDPWYGTLQEGGNDIVLPLYHIQITGNK